MSNTPCNVSITVSTINSQYLCRVQAILPNPDPAAVGVSRLKNCVAYARKVEGDMYETANDRVRHCFDVIDNLEVS